MNDVPLHVLAIAGSLRRASYNRGLVRAAQALQLDGIAIETCELANIPMYDGDVEAQGDPEPVRAFKAHIAAADALLIATPEYNYSVPGVLKNALDWASRPAATSPLRDKPVAIMGATPGGFGTVRAQMALRQSFVFTASCCMVRPELLVSHARDKFDAHGDLTDGPTREALRALLVALGAWTRRLRVLSGT